MGGRGLAPPRLTGLPCSTEVFICTSPLLKYEHCVGEKVRPPRRLETNSPSTSWF